MQSKSVKLTINRQLYNEGMFLVKDLGYSNIQELVAESLRNKIQEIKVQRIIADLEKLKGSAKPRPRLTRAQREKIAREHTPERARQITKEFGLDKLKGFRKSDF